MGIEEEGWTKLRQPCCLSFWQKKKELMQVHWWERRKTGLILFCYLPKLSLIPLILLELIWLKSLSPGSMPFAIFWDFFQITLT